MLRELAPSSFVIGFRRRDRIRNPVRNIDAPINERHERPSNDDSVHWKVYDLQDLPDSHRFGSQFGIIKSSNFFNLKI